jgi:hypothetical protein
MDPQIDVESRERLVRVETKLDAALQAIKAVHERQEACPARQAYLSKRLVSAEQDIRRQRFFGITGWTLAILGGLMNFGPKLVDFIKKL